LPVMPRMFMAMRREDATPILEILDRTPAIPDNCQWGLFLRNHDELTLEMVTDEERDYMYSEYAKDPRMKLNLGIRRRLAPLLDNNRDEFELLHAILFSLPGSPVLYYGDEIGMGDNVYLGDRDGVRTPMHWTGDRNAGFSRADWAQLYLQPLMDPVSGYQAVNGEAQLRTPTSLLRWLHRFIALRKEHPVFGLGTYEPLRAENTKIFAHIRRWEEDSGMCVHNLARSAQAVELVELRYETGAHDIYRLVHGEEEIDGLDDPAAARELVHAMRAGLTLQGREGTVEFRPVEGFAGLGRELQDARLVGAEQSNTSLVFDDELILKVFRRLEPGINPELEMLRFLTEHGFEHIAALGGWYAYSGGPLSATLGILQEFVSEGEDGWELALREIAEDPDRFLARVRLLGEVTGEMHTVLGADTGDPAFCPETPSVESLGLLTATVDEEIESVFLALPEDDEQLAPILGRGEEVREQLRMLTHAGAVGKVIRTHGDYHLGQTLWSPRGTTTPGLVGALEAPRGGDWVILDFEGEPARALIERRRKRSPLRDVAGMLHSFAYVAIA